MDINAAIILMVFCLVSGYGLCLLVQKLQLISRHEFQAYSDEDLKDKRESLAGTVRYRAEHHRHIIAEPLSLMVRIDKELAKRARLSTVRMGRYELESKKDTNAKLIAQFDEVFEMVLDHAESRKKS
jgi:hypothetical protein